MHIKSLSLLAVATLSVLPAKAAHSASDKGSNYQNPWGPANPQFKTNTGFASWVFEQWNPPTQSPAKTPFFIDTARGAWGINVPADILGMQGYDAAWISFTGDGYLHGGQTFTTTVLFTVPGPYLATQTPTEGIDFVAQSATVPSRYLGFGHQVVGIYLGPSPTGPTFYLAVHPILSDENPGVFRPIDALTRLISAANTANNPLKVRVSYTQLPQGHWVVFLVTTVGPRVFTSILTSVQYGPTWNKAPAEGIGAVRYFTSQGGVTPGGPLEWTDMWLR